MAKVSLEGVTAEALKYELRRRELREDVDAFKRTAVLAADKAHEFLRATPEAQKALRSELNELLYQVAYKVRKFQKFAGAAPKRTARKEQEG